MSANSNTIYLSQDHENAGAFTKVSPEDSFWVDLSSLAHLLSSMLLGETTNFYCPNNVSLPRGKKGLPARYVLNIIGVWTNWAFMLSFVISL
jgi:hypothetical protein